MANALANRFLLSHPADAKKYYLSVDVMVT